MTQAVAEMHPFYFIQMEEKTMSKILELREKRAKAWDAAKQFLDAKRGADGMSLWELPGKQWPFDLTDVTWLG